MPHSSELSHWNSSNEGSQNIFWYRNITKYVFGIEIWKIIPKLSLLTPLI